MNAGDTHSTGNSGCQGADLPASESFRPDGARFARVLRNHIQRSFPVRASAASRSCCGRTRSKARVVSERTDAGGCGNEQQSEQWPDSVRHLAQVKQAKECHGGAVCRRRCLLEHNSRVYQTL